MKPLKILTILAFAVFAIFPGFSQNYEDSLLETLSVNPRNKEALFLLGEYCVQRNPVRAEHYADELKEQTRNSSDSNELVRINEIYAASHRWQGNYATSLGYYEWNYQYYLRNNDREGVAKSAAKLGTIHLYIGNNIIAQKYLLKSDEIYSSIGTLDQKASSKLRLANFHIGIQQIEEGKKLYEEVLEDYTKIKDSSGIATVCINLGSVLTEQGEFEKAETYLLNALNYCEVFPTERELGFAHDFLGLLRQAQGRLDEAYQEHLTALDIRLKLSSTYNLCESRLNLGKILIKLGKYEAAISQLNQVFTYGEHRSLNQQSVAHDLLSEAYENMGKYALALEHQKRLKVISDSILNTSSLEVIAQKEAQYKKKAQDARIKILSQEKELAVQKAFRSNVITYGSVAIAIVVLSLSFFVYYLYLKVKRQKNALAKSLIEKEALLKEIHHRVKNNLQLVSSLLSIQRRQIQDSVASAALEESQNRIQSMALIHQNLYREKGLKDIDASSFMEKIAQDLVHIYKGGGQNVSLELRVDKVTLDLEKIVPIGFIVNELVTNAFKYAFDVHRNGVLTIELRLKGQSLYMKVADNGRGFPESFSIDQNKNLGFKLIRLFANKLRAELKVETNKRGAGAEIYLVIPYNQTK